MQIIAPVFWLFLFEKTSAKAVYPSIMTKYEKELTFLMNQVKPGVLPAELENDYRQFAALLGIPTFIGKKTTTKKKAQTNNGALYHLVSVRFENSSRIYDYLCNDFSVKPGDSVVVDTKNGEITVAICGVSDVTEDGLKLPVDKYKYIIKKED